MTRTVHRLYISTFVLIILFSSFYLIWVGTDYYNTPLEERFYHDNHAWLKPSGPFGHGLGIVGTLFILIGVFSYMARKRIRRFSRIGVLKYWLEFHIFLCVLGPILILFHTAFKFGGIVSVSFWSMVIVVLSGVIGRFIYLQIPRTIQGRELSLNELHDMRADLNVVISDKYEVSPEDRAHLESIVRKTETKGIIGQFFEDRRKLAQVRRILLSNGLERRDVKKAIKLIRSELTLNSRIARLRTMQKLFRYWHVAHLPFAIVMLVIMIIHVGVTLAFGYRWIF